MKVRLRIKGGDMKEFPNGKVLRVAIGDNTGHGQRLEIEYYGYGGADSKGRTGEALKRAAYGLSEVGYLEVES